ncbi:MAG: hypothetical protein HYT80_11870, partial [Euryarchaeota archaeon]|nr:hypothetical protein [Euryarchaeota archaeon]
RQLAMHLGEATDLDELTRRYDFRGDDELTLSEAMRLMDELQQMTELERQLRRAQSPSDLEKIDPAQVERLLGQESARDLERLRELAKKLEEAGYLEEKGGELALTADTPQGVYGSGHPPAAQIKPKGSLITLPLREYHDPIDQGFLSVGTIRLTALGDHDKAVNPGKGAVFRFDLTNSGLDDQVLRLSAEGINAGWASIHEGENMRVPADSNRQVSVIVRAPDDANEGERAELFLVAESLDNPSIVALGRVRARVVSAETTQIPDEAATLSPDASTNGTPGPSLAIVLGTLAAAISLRRPPRRPGPGGASGQGSYSRREGAGPRALAL